VIEPAPSPKASPAAPACWPPLFLRAAVAAAFGLLTVFWQHPDGAAAGWAAAAYLLGTAASLLWLGRVIPSAGPGAAAGSAARGKYLTLILFLLAAVIFILPFGSVFSGWAGGVALLAAGGSELIQGLRSRANSPLARDAITTGAISAGAGVLLALVAPLGYKAVLGVLGGSAVILAVLLVLAGLSYRHDAVSTGQAVN
jgi:hypothetical protein